MEKYLMLSWTLDDFKHLAKKAVNESLDIDLNKGYVFIYDDSDKDVEELTEIICLYIEKKYNVKAKVTISNKSKDYYLFCTDCDHYLPKYHDIFLLCEVD